MDPCLLCQGGWIWGQEDGEPGEALRALGSDSSPVGWTGSVLVLILPTSNVSPAKLLKVLSGRGPELALCSPYEKISVVFLF